MHKHLISPSRAARTVLLLTACCALAGVAMEIINAWSSPSWIPADAGYTTSFDAGWASGLNRLSYFTTQSNLLLAAICSWMGLRREHGRTSRTIHLIALVDITLTAAVYLLVLLGPNIGVPFPASVIIASALEHVVTPSLAWVGLFLVPPVHPSRRHLVISLIVPALYCAFTLTRGILVDWYPYPFLDLPGIGPAAVALHTALLALAPPAIVAVIALSLQARAAIQRRLTGATETDLVMERL